MKRISTKQSLMYTCRLCPEIGGFNHYDSAKLHVCNQHPLAQSTSNLDGPVRGWNNVSEINLKII